MIMPMMEVYGFSSILLFNLIQPIGDSCQRFIPGDAFPFAFSSLSDSFHRRSESIRRIQELFDMFPSQCQFTFPLRVCRISTHFNNLSSFDLDPHATL